MKRIAAALLALLLALQLTACGEVKKTEALIDAIGEVGPESREAIDAAQRAYDALDERQQAKVSNAGALAAAQEVCALLTLEEGYAAAERAFSAGDYDTAAALFSGLGDFRDAAERAAACGPAAEFAAGEAACAAGSYAEAAVIYAGLGDYDGAPEKLLACAAALLDAGDWEAALEAFALSASEEAAAGAAYAQGCIAAGKNRYEEAAALFEEAGEYRDAAERLDEVRFRQAETCWREGKLNTAAAWYEKLPEDYARDEISRAERLALLEKYRPFAALCGVWESSEPLAFSVCRTHERLKLWDRWDNTMSGCTLTVTCLLDEEGATLRAEAVFQRYVNFSLDAAELQTEAERCAFCCSGTRLPESLTPESLEPDTEAALSLENGRFALDYRRTDTDGDYGYLYAASGTFDVLRQEY